MRKVTLCFLTFLCSMAAWAQFSNMSFEEWQEGDSLYIQPTATPGDFYCSAFLSNLYEGSPNMTRVDGASGYGIRVETTPGGGLGYFMFGRTYSEGLESDENFYGGFPFYNDNAVRMKCDMRFDVPTYDSAHVIVGFVYSDSVISFNSFKIAGKQETFQTMTFELERLDMQPNRCFIAFTSEDSRNFNSVPGSYVEVDNILLEGTNNEQYYVPNGNFEEWETAHNMECPGWKGYNEVPHDPCFMRVEDDVMDGNYAVKVVTMQLPGEEAMGFLEIGHITFDEVIPAIDLQGEVPDTFSFYYKYEPAEGLPDTALCAIAFTSYDEEFNKTNTVGFNQSKLLARDQWTKVSIPIVYEQGLMPDSMAVLFVASHEEPGVTPNKSKVGSALYLDNIELKMAEPLADKSIKLSSTLAVAPNPSTGLVTLMPNQEETSFRLFDIAGNKVYETAISQVQRVNLTEKPGVYFYIFTDKEGNVSRSGKLLLK